MQRHTFSTRTCRAALAALAVIGVTGTADAASVDWTVFAPLEGMVDGLGQTFQDFAGIAGLTVTLNGANNSSVFGVNGAMWFPPNQQLLMANNAAGATFGQPVSLTFTFNQKVNALLSFDYFGDSGVPERMRLFSSAPGTTFDVVTQNNVSTIAGDETAVLEATAFTGPSTMTVAPSATDSFSLLIGGLSGDFTGNAGITLAMQVETAPVPLPAPALLLAAGLAGIGAMRLRRGKRD